MSTGPRPPPRTLAEYQLKRTSDPLSIFSHFDYLQPFVGATTANDWNAFTIDKVEDTGGDEILGYATSLSLETYQVLNAQFVDFTGKRFTEMRLHEAIRSTWAIESATELKRLGIQQIENTDARMAITSEFERAAKTAIGREFDRAVSQGANPAGSTVTISLAEVLSPYWQDNPFIWTAVKVAGDKNKVVAHLIKEDTNRLPRMNMVCELDAGQTTSSSIPSSIASNDETSYAARSNAGSASGSPK